MTPGKHTPIISLWLVCTAMSLTAQVISPDNADITQPTTSTETVIAVPADQNTTQPAVSSFENTPSTAPRQIVNENLRSTETQPGAQLTTAPEAPQAAQPPAATQAPQPPATPPAPDTTPADEPTSITTDKGVIYQVLKPGTGPQEQSTNTLVLHYTLYLTDGTKIESSRDAEFPVPLKLQRNQGAFIEGFEIGTKGMRIGEIRKIYIPSKLAYGEKGTEVIPPDTPLVFITELVDLK